MCGACCILWMVTHDQYNFDNLFRGSLACVLPMECKLMKANFVDENLMGSKVTAKFKEVTV